MEFYWSPFLVQLEVNKTDGKRVLKLDTISATAKKWKGADIMVFNTGHWWVHLGKLQAYVIALSLSSQCFCFLVTLYNTLLIRGDLGWIYKLNQSRKN